MITSAFFYLIFRTLTGALQQLDDVSVTSPFVSGTAKAAQYLSSMSQIVPVTPLTVGLLFLFGFEVAYIGFKVVYWVIRRIPSQS